MGGLVSGEVRVDGIWISHLFKTNADWANNYNKFVVGPFLICEDLDAHMAAYLKKQPYIEKVYMYKGYWSVVAKAK